MSEGELQEQQEQRDRQWALLLLPAGLLASACCLWTLFANVGRGEAEAFIPAPLHSSARANYAQDSLLGGMQSLSISIIDSVIRDLDPEAEDVEERAAEVQQSMQTAVPTVSGASTTTPTAPPTSTSTPGPPSETPDPSITPTITPTQSITPTPSATRTPTPTWTPGGPSPTPSKTPTGCKVPPYVEILAPLDGQVFDLTMELPGKAFAFDPDNANPSTCSDTPSGEDGEGISGSPEVEMYIEWWSGSSWVLVHTELENDEPYCAFSGCVTYDLSSGFWEDPDGPGPLTAPPINTGLHRMKVKARDDEGVWSGYHIHQFSIVTPTPTPSPTPSKTPTPSNTPTPSLTPTPSFTPSDTPPPSCPDFSLSWKNNGGQHVEWYLTNNGSATVTLVRIQLTWPSGSDLDKIELNGSDIWNGSASSPADISGSWTGVSRDFSSGETKTLRFNLSSSLEVGDYLVTVHSSASCSDSHTQFVNP